MEVRKEDFIQIKKKKNPNFIEKNLGIAAESFEFLSKVNFLITYKTFKKILIISSIFGIVIGIILRNFLISISFAILFPLIELELLQFFKKDIENELEININKIAVKIKNTFSHSQDVVRSVIDNKPNISPIKELFEEFEQDIEVYHLSTKEALLEMKKKLKSTSFHSLIDQLILCDEDRENYSSLVATVEQLNDRSRFLNLWNVIKKNMMETYFFGLVLVNGIVITLAYALRDIAKVFLVSKMSKYIIAIYIISHILISISAIKVINKEV